MSEVQEEGRKEGRRGGEVSAEPIMMLRVWGDDDDGVAR